MKTKKAIMEGLGGIILKIALFLLLLFAVGLLIARLMGQ